VYQYTTDERICLMTEELTEREEALLAVVRRVSNGVWVKRKAIAIALGKKVLNAADIAVLEGLAKRGQIEAEESTDTRAPSGRVMRYRAKGE
jgi:hypothetical protein